MLPGKKKYCVIKGVAGLGNRLITLSKAIEYAEATGRTLYVDWRDGMNGPIQKNVFYNYFELHGIDCTSDPAEIVERLNNGADIYPAFYNLPDFNRPMHEMCNYLRPSVIKKNKIKIALSFIFRHKAGNLVGLDSWELKNAPKSTSYKKSIQGFFSSDNFPPGGRLSKKLTQDIVIFADFQPICFFNNFRRHVSLKKEYRDAFSAFALKNTLSEAVGVHIRHTDKSPPTQLSKLPAKISDLMRSEPGLKVFLSTDNNDIEEIFKKEFGDKLIVYPKNIPTVSRGGIHHWARRCKDEDVKRRIFEESLADMWLLSMTKYLFRQGNSSFSHISKLLKDDPLRTYDWLKL
jgi:hypothetical protein